jgi:hypothetical protein
MSFSYKCLHIHIFEFVHKMQEPFNKAYWILLKTKCKENGRALITVMV